VFEYNLDDSHIRLLLRLVIANRVGSMSEAATRRSLISEVGKRLDVGRAQARR
jgi:hypothetical protein